MSFKAKNLTYEKPDEPEFLQRLREQVSGRGDADRHEIAAPKRRGVAKIDALEDDAPVIVGEDGNVLHEDEVKAIKEQSDDMPHGGKHLDTKAPSQSRELKAEGQGIGPARKKRKAIKVVDDENKEAPENNESASKGPASVNSAAGKPPVKKSKKRAKVTLSFDNDDDG